MASHRNPYQTNTLFHLAKYPYSFAFRNKNTSIMKRNLLVILFIFHTLISAISVNTIYALPATSSIAGENTKEDMCCVANSACNKNE